MPISTNGFPERIAGLQARLAVQGRSTQALLEAAFDAAFARDVEGAKAAIALDEKIDTEDVEIERAAVALLSEATADGAALSKDLLRRVLTIVKVNNELERIADAGVAIGEHVQELAAQDVRLSETFRVMTNSVIGILRDSCMALERNDGHLAKIVLASEDAVEAFKRAILRDLQVQISSGKLSMDAAFVVQELATQCEVIAGHCTNIAEQALYVATGKIVRHMSGRWQEVPVPPKA
ncbi:MAG TPA: PhoU domain-containing protein [Phycisphaerales bacterium]|nr:PhoU domain-containing protein [Phycisphaerales bacterium]